MGMWTKCNKTTRTRSTFITFDTETRADSIPGQRNRVIHRFKLGHAKSFRLENGIMTRRKQIDFTDPAYFWNWVVSHLSEERPVVCYAHNIAFDLTVLKVWELIEGETFTIRRFVNTDPPFIMRCQHERGRVEFIDSLNWFQVPLAQIAADVGMSKVDVDFTTCEDYELMEHCRQDVAILERRIFTLINWVREHDLGVMQRTAPSQAMQAFKHRFSPHPEEARRNGPGGVSDKADRPAVCYPRLHQCPGIAALERNAYFGGEARIFRASSVVDPDMVETVALYGKGRKKKVTVEGPIYHLDVNSLYPYVMKANLYPGAFLQRIDRPSVEKLEQLCKNHELIAHVKLYTPSETFPTRDDDKPIYAIGSYWTSLCGNELRYALQKAYVQEVEYILLYEPVDLFSKYVDYFYPLKVQYQREGDKSSAAVCKMMLNSLQAKWGGKSYKWIDCPDVEPAKPWGMWPEPDRETGETVWCRGIGSHKQKRGNNGDSRESFISIPACVTANGRQYMRECRLQAGESNVLYQHTDSLHTTQAGYDNLRRLGLVDDTRLGAFKLEEKITFGEYRGINDYDANGVTIQAGINWSKVRREKDGPVIDRFEGSASIVNSKPADGICVETQRIVPYYHDYSGRIDSQGVIHPVKLGG